MRLSHDFTRKKFSWKRFLIIKEVLHSADLSNENLLTGKIVYLH